MKKKFKLEKGITLITLSVVVIVLLIITGTMIYNVKSNLGVGRLKNMQSDIENLRDKISVYYAQYGAIPISVEYTNEDRLNEINVISDAVDTGKFYVIDLSAIENLTLNYGTDYEKIRNNEVTTTEQANQLEDIYIINETSHNIFYLRGIKFDNEWFYTDYTQDDVDTKKVDLRYVEGVKIPKGFYYVGGTKEEGIVISDNISDLGKGTSHEAAQSLQGNQFVWVPVEDSSTFVTRDGYEDGLIQTYVADGSTHEPSQTGYQYTNEESEYNVMKASVIYNKGFYVARYEASKNNTTGKVESKQGKNVWNNIAWGNSMTNIGTSGAVYQSQNMYTDTDTYEVTSTLIYGVQWDAIMKWMENVQNPNVSGKTYIQDSTGKGYYGESSPTTTGSNDSYAVKNIYDIAGNVYEWTMEACNTYLRVLRGGCYYDDGSEVSASSRAYCVPDGTLDNSGFRVALYMKFTVADAKKADTILSKTGNTILKDDESNLVTIPAGFKVASDSATSVTEGIVIEDEDVTIDGNGKKRGNQFVWIPVTKDANGNNTTPYSKTGKLATGEVIKLSRYEFADGTSNYTANDGTSLGKMAAGTPIDRGTAAIVDNDNGSYSHTEDTTDGNNTHAIDLEAFKTSVATNGGYYIARYEASYGNDGKANSKISTGYSESTAPTTEGTLWNYITQQDAAIASRNMYTSKKITSDLINSYAWDTAILFIQKCGGTEYEAYSKKIGQTINNKLTNTGINNDKTLNICDMAGNVSEWTTETSNAANIYCTNRGGDYYSDYACPNNRGVLSTSYSDSLVTFRPLLYLQD